jgi:carboxylesterase
LTKSKERCELMPAIIPTAEPFLFPGGRTGCLLVHGFTGAPKEMRWMGEYLAAQGYTALGVRLAGHATQPADLLRTRWPDWLLSVEDGYHLLRGACDRVFLIGLSMGGVLSLLFAARYAAACPVAGLVCLSTPYQMPDDWRLPYLRFFSLIQPSLAKGQPDWRNPEAARDHVDYPDYPLRAVAELRDLLAEMRSGLPQIQVPALVALAHGDASAEPMHMPAVYDHLGSSDKQLMWVENSGHVIPREPERQRVFEAAAAFIRRIEGQPV